MQKQDIEKIYNNNFSAIYKYLICLTRDEDLAEELAQETFYKAIENINRFRGECKITTWLCKIAKNVWINDIKKKNKIKITEINDDIEDFTYNLEENYIKKEEKKNLYKKILKLDKEWINIFYLRLYGNMTFKEISDVIGKSSTWIRVNYYRIKQKMKEDDKDE